MNPQEVFCPNIECRARGEVGKGNIGIHSHSEQRYICHECGQTFSATKGTLFYRLRTDPKTVLLVITLLAYGAPLQAIVKAFGFHERTVKKWWQRSGEHCRVVHEHIIESQVFDLQHVQADEIKVKLKGGYVWMAMAIMVSTRLWLGGVVSAKRDLHLIQALAQRIRGMALCRELLLAVDGLSSYVKAFRRAFRTPLKGQGRGRPRLISWPDIVIVQVVKQRKKGWLHIERRIVQGAQDMLARLLQATQGGGMINTAYIERLNATFRQRLAWLMRRTRHLAQRAQTVEAGMFVVGCLHNLCEYHHSLRVKLSVGRRGYRWVQRTPAMAAGVTDHRWSVEEVLTFKVPPPPWEEPPKRRGKAAKALPTRTAA